MTYNENILESLKDLDEIKNLSERERQEVEKILKEYSQKGKSDTYNALIWNDYAEIPVNIETFLDDPNYLGNAWHDAEGKSKLYPFWRERLRELFPNNTDTAVNNFIESGARGLGKSEIAVAIACYLMYRIMCLKDPIEYFHLKPTEKICFAFMNIKLALAEEIGISKFQNTVKMSPWFMSKGTLTGRTKKLWVPPEYIQIIIGSQADDLIGLPIYFAFFDEISFMRNQDIDKQKEKAINMIDTAIGGMKTRFIHKGKNPTLLVLASSKRSEKSFLEEHMKKKLKSEHENVLIVDKPVWEVKPKGTYKEETFKVALGNKFLVSQVIPEDADVNAYIEKGYKIIEPPVDFRPNFLDDIERALCDYAGISSTEISKYISGSAWSEIINKDYINPFQKEILEIGNAKDDPLQYYDFFDLNVVRKELKPKPMFVHLDMSISGDMTGISGIWIKGKKPSQTKEQSKDLFFTVAFSVSIKAPKGYQISFEKNRNFVRWLRKQGFNVAGVSTDSFQSYDTGQALQSEEFNYQQISVDKVDSNHVCVPYQYFKTTIYENRLECFEDRTLTEEVIDLERNINTGKVDHPDGGRKDACDSIVGALYNASQHAEEFAYDFGEDLKLAAELATNINSPAEQKKQIQVAFEQELTAMFGKQDILKPKEETQPQSQNKDVEPRKQDFNGFTQEDLEKSKGIKIKPPNLLEETAVKPVLINGDMIIW